MKNITQQQIEQILTIMYSTNIPAQTFDYIKKTLLELPEVKTETGTTGVNNETV